MKMGPSSWAHALNLTDIRELALTLTSCACTEERPCEDIARGHPSPSQEDRWHQKPDWPVPWP